MKIGVKLDGADRVRDLFARLGRLPQQALDATAVEVENFIGVEVGKHAKTGALERSVGKKRLSAKAWLLGHDSRVAPYAVFVHEGTRAHWIRPRNKKALRWVSGGAFRFSKRGVRHPGTKPDKWMERAAARAPQIFEAQLAARIAKP